MHCLKVVLLLRVILSNFHLIYGQYLGNVCHHTAKGVDGICKPIADCSQAIADLKKRIYPQQCGFIGNTAVVCCPSTAFSPTKKPTTPFVIPVTTPSTSKSKPTVENIPGEKSKQKCKDYEKLAYVYERPPILLARQKFLKRSICPWQTDVTPVIVDGEPAKLGEFSHMALLGYSSGSDIEWNCGGSLISEDFVLTAAHCLYSDYGSPRVVRIGDLNYKDASDDSYAQQIPIDKFFKNPSYHPPENYNDLALLKLARRVKLGEFVKPICLYSEPDAIRLSKVLVTGWGHTSFNGKKSDSLMKAALDVFSIKQCNKTYKKEKSELPRGIDGNLQMCAGSFNDKNDTCQGDSGGPIQIRSSTYHCSYFLLGVTSFGKLCGETTIPSVYATVYPHLKWIEDTVWP